MPETTTSPLTRVIVEIYVAAHCPVCAYAYEVATMIRREFPMVDVRLIQIDAMQVDLPDSVFATPTYLLNGQRWSLGNPAPDIVHEVLKQALMA